MTATDSFRPAVPKRASRPLVLRAGCTLVDATVLKAMLLAAGSGSHAAPGFPVMIDGSAVVRVDTAGLQLLVAFALREALAGRRLVWTAVSPELLRASRQLGLADALGLAALAERK